VEWLAKLKPRFAPASKIFRTVGALSLIVWPAVMVSPGTYRVNIASSAFS